MRRRFRLALWRVHLASVLILTAQTPSLDRILQSLRAQEYETALRLIEPLLANAGGDARLWTLQGLALSGQRRWQQSLTSFDQALRIDPEYRAAMMGAAEAAFRMNHPSAGDRLEKVIAKDQANPAAHGMLGMLAYARQDCAGALAHFLKAARAIEHDDRATAQYAHCLLQLRRSGEAVPLFEKLNKRRPGDAGVRFALGLALFESGQYAEASATLNLLQDADAMNLRADAHEAAGQTPQALATLREALTLHRYEERLYISLADLCRRHDNAALGLEVLETAMKNLPRSAAIRSMYGALLAELGRIEEAMVFFDQAAHLDPASTPARLGLSYSLQETGRQEESEHMLREHLHRNPNDAAVHHLLAQLLLKRAPEPATPDYMEAEKLLERALQLEPGQSAPRVDLAKMLAAAGDPEAATQQLQQALRLQPSDQRAMYQLARLFQKSGREREAAELLERVKKELNKALQEEMSRRRQRLVKVD